MTNSPHINDSTWLTHAMVDRAIARKVTIPTTRSYAAECRRVGALWLANLLDRCIADRTDSRYDV